MAKRKSRKQRLLEPLLEKMGPEIEAAFLASVDLIRSDVEFNRLVARIAAGDIVGALDALHVNAAAFSRFNAALASAFAQGGDAGARSMPKRRPNGQRFVIRFDGSQPDAERWIKNYSGAKVKEIVDDQLNMIRDALSRGIADGKNPRTVALDIAGRMNKGKREGGLIGLTKEQEKIVANFEKMLRDDPGAYFVRDRKTGELGLRYKLADRRFDGHVKKALKDGKPIPADTIQKMVSRYKDNFLKLRADTIGRTEALSTLHKGRLESFEQAVRNGDVGPEEVEREWQSAQDSRVRESHAEMNGQTIGLNDFYETPDGAALMYPGDPSGPPEEIINCRCTEEIRINFLARLKRRD